MNSIESLVSHNIERLAGFLRHHRGAVLRELLENYNQRIKTLERDQSLLIAIPENLNG